MMAGIRSGNTKPELTIRKALHRLGLRYTLHAKNVPGGKPDLAFPSRHAAVFIHGCFWHGHRCPMFKLPQTRPDFWRAKIGANSARDKVTVEALRSAGWRQLTVWECALKGPRKLSVEEVVDICEAFLVSASGACEVSARWVESTPPVIAK